MKTKNIITPDSKKSISRSPLRLDLLLIPLALALACFAFSPQARAVCRQGCDLSNANTFLGDDALLNNTTGNQNTANGASALLNNTTGSNNTAIGYHALYNNTTSLFNTAIGASALAVNTTGAQNTAVGGALFANTTGALNTAVGTGALTGNTTGSANVAIGNLALNKSITGGFNTVIGVGALQKSKGSNNTAIGWNAGSFLRMGDHNIYIDSGGPGEETGVIRIGTASYHQATFDAGISGATVAGGVTVVVDANGQLGTLTSSARYKDSIQPLDKASEVILSLKPVTFHYKKELDPKGIPQFGLVAEDVEKVNPDLVARDDQGKPYSVRYEAVNAMLLNEFLKARRQIDAQQQQIEALTAGLQKVSAQLAASKPAPQVVNNP